MQHSTHAPTQTEADRIAEFRWLGCVVCRLYFVPTFAYDVHHLVQGGRRMGHRYTIPLHIWFHRGHVPEDCASEAEADRKYGPSLALSPERFEKRFGTQFELLEATDLMIARKRSIETRAGRPRRDEPAPIVPREWTLVSHVAVKTRSMSIATKVAAQATEGTSGRIDGVEWMSSELFEKRTA